LIKELEKCIFHYPFKVCKSNAFIQSLSGNKVKV